jgi:hypothetical protein
MADILADAAAWLTGMRQEHMSHTATYCRGGVAVPVGVTVDRSVWEVVSEQGVVERWESRDFVISTAEFPFEEPARGDVISETLGGKTVNYAVMSPRGMPLWHPADAYRTAIKVHTKMVAER